MKTTLSDLSPLIQASELWSKNKELELWLGYNEGKVYLSLEEPKNLFCRLLTCNNLEEVGVTEEILCFVEWPSGKHQLFIPEAWETTTPLLGRPYQLGKWDCYSLTRDYMKQAHNVDMAWLTETKVRLLDNFLEDSAFIENEELKNWEKVAIPQIGDGILFSINTDKTFNTRHPNHCGIYIGVDKFIHHFPNRISCEQTLSSTWKNWIVTYMRYKT